MRIKRTAIPALGITLTLGLALTACGEDEPETTASDLNAGSGGTTSQPTETAPATDTPTTAETGGEGSPDTVAVPVYFVGDTPMGARLYREFRRVESDNPAEEALALLLAGDALDADYRTELGGLEVTGLEIDDDEITVDVGGSDNPTTGDAKLDQLAVQSLVYTLQGVIGERIPVEFDAEDGGPTTIYGVAEGTAVKAAKQNDVLALVSISTPNEGEVVSGSFMASGVANSFEATVPWEIVDAEGNVVATYSAMAEGAYDKLYAWETEIDVSDIEPGTYTFIARTDDPSDGEGPGPFEDTKTITIQ